MAEATLHCQQPALTALLCRCIGFAMPSYRKLGSMHHSIKQQRTLFVRYLQPQAARVFLLALLLFGSIGLQLVNPQIVRRFIDAAQAGAALNALTQIALLFLSAALLKYAISLGVSYLSQTVGWTATNALRTDLAAHCLGLDMAFHNQHTPGELIERVDGDVGKLVRFFSQLVIQLFGNVLLLVGILLVLYWEDWRVGLAFTAFSAGAVLILATLRDFSTTYMQARQAANANLYGFLEERLGGVDDIRANGAIAYTINRLFGYEREAWRTGHAATWRSALFGSITVVWFELGTVLALALGVWLFQGNLISIGTVYLLYAYMRMVSDPLLEMSTEIQHLQEATASLWRIGELFQTQTLIRDGGRALLPAGALPVEFEHISFGYALSDQAGVPLPDAEAASEAGEPRRQVLEDICYHLAPGRTLGLLGRTGSGKTTLTRLLLRLYEPQAGAIRLGSVDLRDLPLADLRRQVGVVTQDVQLFHASVRDNLTFFDGQIGDSQIEAALGAVGLDGWLQSLPQGLDSELAAGGSSLSAGQAQLLAFARILLKDPRVVILDEASSRLDPATERQLDQAIARLLAGRTGIIIAHRLATVQKVDEIVILEAGRIRESGPRAALANDPDSRFAQLLRTGLQEVLA